MSANSITIDQTIASVTLSATQTEGGTPLANPNPDYGAASYAVDNPALGSIQVLSANGPESFVRVSGAIGTANVTASEVSSVTGESEITGTLAVVMTGPLPDGLDVVGTPVAAS